jgi:hypothetical protein
VNFKMGKEMAKERSYIKTIILIKEIEKMVCRRD